MSNFLGRLSERQKKMLGWVALAAVLGVGLLILQPASSPTSPSPPAKPPEIPQSLTAKESWERQLTLMLDGLLGGRHSQVFLTLERGVKLSIAYSLSEEERQLAQGGQERRLTSNPTILRDEGARQEMPLVLEQEEPLVRGVLVILDWEPDADLRWRVAEAVQTVLQVPMYRIEVLFKE